MAIYMCRIVSSQEQKLATFAIVGGFTPQLLSNKFKKLQTKLIDFSKAGKAEAECNGGVSVTFSGKLFGKDFDDARVFASDIGSLLDAFATDSPVLPSIRRWGSDLCEAIDGGLIDIKHKLGHHPDIQVTIRTNLDKSVEAHPPPPVLASRLEVSSCKDTCPSCKSLGCYSCGKCVYSSHSTSTSLEGQDVGLKLFIGWQQKATMKQRAHFFLGDNVFDLSEGLAGLFDSTHVPHGVWSPPCASTYYIVEVILPPEVSSRMSRVSMPNDTAEKTIDKAEVDC